MNYTIILSEWITVHVHYKEGGGEDIKPCLSKFLWKQIKKNKGIKEVW